MKSKLIWYIATGAIAGLVAGASRGEGLGNQFLAHINGKKSASLIAVGHQDILGFIESREQAGVAPKTLSTDVRALRPCPSGAPPDAARTRSSSHLP
jgi:hypothetical protein